jgi:hypothetical protein
MPTSERQKPRFLPRLHRGTAVISAAASAAANKKIAARIIHRQAAGGAGFGTLNGGGSSRHGWVFVRRGGAGVSRAGIFRAFAVSGVSSPGGIFSGAMLPAFM